MIVRQALSLEQLRCLYGMVRQEFAPIACRELLCAASGLKVSRMLMGSQGAQRLEATLADFGLSSARSARRYLLRRDIGKGGWCSRIATEVPFDDERGYWTLYVGCSAEAVERTRDAEATGRDSGFSAALGIPDCCAQFYREHIQAARRKQEDFVPFTFHNTKGPYPFDYWNNYTAQYFGFSLISFFPCSFHCKHSARSAQMSYQFLLQVAPDLAEQSLHCQRQSVLYTEYQGVYLFEGARFKEDTLHYDPRQIRATAQRSRLLTKLRLGDRLRIIERQAIAVLSKTEILTTLRSADVAPCIF